MNPGDAGPAIARNLLLIAAVGLLIAGVALGFMGVGNDCGSAFAEGSGLLDAEVCDSIRAQARPLPVMLLIFGVTVGLGAATLDSTKGGPSLAELKNPPRA